MKTDSPLHPHKLPFFSIILQSNNKIHFVKQFLQCRCLVTRSGYQTSSLILYIYLSSNVCSTLAGLYRFYYVDKMLFEKELSDTYCLFRVPCKIRITMEFRSNMIFYPFAIQHSANQFS